LKLFSTLQPPSRSTSTTGISITGHDDPNADNCSRMREEIEKSFRMSNSQGSNDPYFISKPWLRRFEELQKYQDKNGNCNVPRNYGPLGNWVQKQRLAYKNYKSLKERQAMIDIQAALLITPSSSSSKSSSYSAPPSPLLEEQVKLLSELGFIWDVHEHKYQSNLDSLRNFRKEHGHIDVPSSPVDGPYRSLYKWTCRQKEEYRLYLDGDAQDVDDENNKKRRRRTHLTNERRVALEELGFHIGMFDFADDAEDQTTLDSNAVISGSSSTSILSTSKSRRKPRKRFSWEMRFQQLMAFRDEHGHCNVPTNDVRYERLSSWVQHQRAEKKKKDRGVESRLCDERELTLVDAGFIWSSKEYKWQQQLQELRYYKETHGHCNIPTKDGDLGGWVMTQRLQYNKNILSDERITALDEIDFIWDMHNLAWKARFEELRGAMARAVASYDVRDISLSPTLTAWTATQRAEKRYKDMGLQNHLFDKRERLLNEIGFEWNVNEQREKNRSAAWMNNFQTLQEYIEATGSCKVPLYEGNSFAIWVRDQRRYAKAFDSGLDSPMTSERRNKLLSIGFE